MRLTAKIKHAAVPIQLKRFCVGKGIIPSTSLATGGTLGGSQAGARLTYRFNEAWAATLRSTSSAGGVRGAEAAAGIRWQPLRSIPLALTAERRHKLGTYGGRSAFALFAEGGIYHRALFNKIYLDGYIQGGVVGLRRRDLFVDGGATLSRPVWRNHGSKRVAMPKPPSSPRGKMWTRLMQLFPRRIGAHSGLMTQVIFAPGLASRIAATAGNVCTTSPSELGLMIRMERISDFRFQISDWKRRSIICNLKFPLAPQLQPIGE